MSEQAPENNQDLAQVLGRINALMKHGDKSAPALDDEIPLLTEVYEGEPLTFTSHRPKPASPDTTEIIEGLDSKLSVTGPTHEMLNELLPLIQAAVRTAVQQELANAEQKLRSKIEVDVLESLRQRLRS
ncbi:MAG TPA: hypothetical protein VIE91_03990 [Methylophilaceae bacterium]|jgi:hypothetical protein